MYPECPEKSFEVDEMIAAFEDVRMTFVPTFAIADQAEKEASRAALVTEDGKTTAILRKVEKFVGEKYVVGDFLTIADVWGFMILNLLRCGFLDGFPADYLGKYPKLTAICANVASVPGIKEFVDAKVAGGNGMYKVMQC
jgi:glutathione S-transferase